MKTETDLARVAQSAYDFFANRWREMNLEKIGLGKFPDGWCADASLILGRYYHENSFGAVNIVRGSLSKLRTHAWLFVSNWHIDITLSQFPEAHQRVYVAKVPPAFIKRIESRRCVVSAWEGIQHRHLLENAYCLFRDAQKPI